MLGWGGRFLVCPPTHFGVLYEINPWMSRTVDVDLDRAQAQWDDLVRLLTDAGAAVERLEPVEGLPDLVFTANAGIVDGATFVPARFANPERRGEEPVDVAWFADRGWEVLHLPGDAPTRVRATPCRSAATSSAATAGGATRLRRSRWVPRWAPPCTWWSWPTSGSTTST